MLYDSIGFIGTAGNHRRAVLQLNSLGCTRRLRGGSLLGGSAKPGGPTRGVGGQDRALEQQQGRQKTGGSLSKMFEFHWKQLPPSIFPFLLGNAKGSHAAPPKFPNFTSIIFRFFPMSTKFFEDFTVILHITI